MTLDMNSVVYQPLNNIKCFVVYLFRLILFICIITEHGSHNYNL